MTATSSTMKNLHHHNHLPTMGMSDEEEHQRRATAFLSNWINQNSFRTESSSTRSSIHSRSLHAPSSSPTRHSNDSSNKHQRGGGHHRRSNSALDDLPNNKSQVKQQKQQEIGVAGKHTGQVNHRMQPHRSGALIYKDGSADPSIWKKGIADSKKQQKHQEHHQGQPLLSSKDSSSSRSASSNQTYLPHLDLGDVGTPQDMIIDSDSQPIALEEMNSLQKHDFAFILRSGGQWTYAIIADRQKNAIRFVVDADGDNKTLSRKRWSTSIRLVNPDKACCNSATRSNTSKQSKKARNGKSSKQKEKMDRKVQQKQKQRSI